MTDRPSAGEAEEPRDILEVLREAAEVYRGDEGPAHSARYDRAAEEIESLRFAISCRTLSEEAVHIMRERCEEGLGFSCTFVDDDMNVLVALAQRAVLAGLASDAQPDMKRRMTEAAEKHRDGHERALGYPIPPRSEASGPSTMTPKDGE